MHNHFSTNKEINMSNINSGANTGKGPQGDSSKQSNSEYPASTRSTANGVKDDVAKTLNK